MRQAAAGTGTSWSGLPISDIGVIAGFTGRRCRPPALADRAGAGTVMAGAAVAAARRAGLWAPSHVPGSPGRWRRAGSAGRRPDPQPVTVRVAKFELAPIGRLACGPAELGHDRLHIAHKQVDQGVRPGIAPVLGKKQPRFPASDRYERRHAGLEAMLPLVGETQALVPFDRISGAGHTQHGDDLVIHGGMVPHVSGYGRFARP